MHLVTPTPSTFSTSNLAPTCQGWCPPRWCVMPLPACTPWLRPAPLLHTPTPPPHSQPPLLLCSGLHHNLEWGVQRCLVAKWIKRWTVDLEVLGMQQIPGCIFFSVFSANPKSRRKVTSCPLEGTKAVSPGGLGLNRLCLLQDIIRYHYAKHIRGDNNFFSDRDIFLLL